MSISALVMLSALATSPAAPEVSESPRHQFSLYGRSGASIYLSSARTHGGVGGGFGVRDTVDGRWLLQADVNALTGLGSAFAVRVGAGVQRQGWWAPAVLLNLSGLFGDRLDFLTPEHPVPVAGPSLGLGLTVAPARFTLGKAQVSVLELGVGVGTDNPGLGLLYGLTLLEVGVALW
ncbi:hypothetical protein [Archangium violaceum]|uniref:Outer membrane protein beta-barrel domain-containing protein n=1 Tax=Archangium violaceum Cb vi76 TaxID=1406225 RepID=A0A084STI0_9BACT|nr:hypothetical protein [Archangium violaceum]KFA91765.1 hypothetical protein Q664_19380 [Archangium violaceum Cb vi76]